MPIASSPKPPTLPAAQVRQYSWHHYTEKNVYDIRREFVGTNRQSNRISSVLSQQTPLVARVHLLDIVRKVGKSERLKGKHLENFIFKAPSPNRERNVTSLLSSRSKSEGGNQQISVISEYSNSEIKPVDQVSRKTNYIYTLKLSKARKTKREAKFKYPGTTNCDVMVSDAITTKANSDVTVRDVNKPITRKRYAQKHSFVAKNGFIKSSLRVCSRTFTKVALMLAIVISILGGLFNIKLPERKSTVGTSSSLSPSEPLVVLSFRDYSSLSSLRESAVAIIGINKGLCSCIHKVIFLNKSKQLIICKKVLQNTIICEETICTNRSLSGRLKLAAPYLCLIMQLALWQRLRETLWWENTLIRIYFHPRTSVLPVLTIWIYIP